MLESENSKYQNKQFIQITSTSKMDSKTVYLAINTINSSSKDDGKTEKVTFMKPRCNNGTECFFYQSVSWVWPWRDFWSQMVLKKCKQEVFCKTWDFAPTLLHSCMLSNLKNIEEVAETFSEAMTALEETCLEKSLIKLGNKLYTLICCNYVPGL